MGVCGGPVLVRFLLIMLYRARVGVKMRDVSIPGSHFPARHSSRISNMSYLGVEREQDPSPGVFCAPALPRPESSNRTTGLSRSAAVPSGTRSPMTGATTAANKDICLARCMQVPSCGVHYGICRVSKRAYWECCLRAPPPILVPPTQHTPLGPVVAEASPAFHPKPRCTAGNSTNRWKGK